MLFETMGSSDAPAVLFFHAMGVTGASSGRVAEYMKDRYFCIMPTSSVYCAGQRYRSKEDELRQVEDFLRTQGVTSLAMVAASSLGADLAAAFLARTQLTVEHAFFDGGQFAQISRGTRLLMTPLLYLAIKSLYWTKGKTLGMMIGCGGPEIRPYFISAGKALTYADLRRQMLDSLEDKPFPALPEGMQPRCYFEFGSREEHFKYREALIRAYPESNFPVFEGFDHMQYQIRDPKGFAGLLVSVIEQNRLPELPFLRE